MTAEPSTAAHLHALTERQATFKHLSNGKKRRTDASNSSSPWPLPANHSVTPAALATAGFYYAPLPDAQDNATCFLCGKGLGGWEDGDQALQEHVSHSIKSSVKKGCPFALLTSGAEKLRELGLEEGKDLVKMRKETFGKKSKFWVHAGQRGWPTPDKMANAGFFLRATDARSDAGQCCWCGLTLDGWEKGDEPLHEHYKRRPTCHLFEAYPALLLQAQAAIGSSAEAAPVDTTAIDDGWEQIDADTTNTNATSSKSRSKTSSRSKAKEQQPDESNASVTGVIASSSVAHGPLTRSTRSGMIASLASTSQPAQSQSTSSKSSRSKSRSTTRGAKAADTSQVQLAEASIAEQPEPDDSVELVQQPKKSSKNSRKEESETAPRSGKSSSSSSSSTGTKSRAAAKQKKAATPEKDVAEEEVEGNHSDAPAPEADEELPEPAHAPVPTPTEAPAPEDEEPAPIPNGNVEPQPERASDPESPPQQHRNDATQLSVVQEGDEDEDGDGEEEQQPAPSSSAAGHKSSIPLLSQLQSRQLRSPPPQASSSQDKASSKGKANAATTKTKDEDNLTSGLDDAQLNMSVQEWFRHLTEVEIARAEQEMQAKLDEYDQSVEKGWERLRGMGIAQ